MQPTLLFGATFSAVSAGIYYYVGQVLSQRRSGSENNRLAWTLFVIWWYALAGATLLGALQSLLGAFGVVHLPLFTTLTLMNLLATCVALCGLMFYLVYLFTGNRRLLMPLIVFYLAYYAFLVYFILASDPVGVNVERWTTTLQYQNQFRGPIFIIALFLLVFPQVFGSLAYFVLYFRVQAATQKYRILLVSWSIFIWFMSAFLASITQLSEQDWWQAASRLIGLSAALVIMFAYQPPSWIRRRFGVTSIAEEISQ